MQQGFTVRVSDVVWFYFHQLLIAIPYKAVISIVASSVIGAYFVLRRGASSSNDNIEVIMAIGTVAGVVLLAALFVLFYLLMIVSNLPENQPTGEIRLTIDSGGVSVQARNRSEVFPWSRINDVGRNSFFVWIHADDKHYRFVPLRRLNDEAAASTIWASIGNYRGAA